VLARGLSSLHNTFAIETATGTLLDPASERGSAGMDELQEQTVNLLNFQPVEKSVFAGQLAFNVLPEPKASENTETCVLDHITGILGQTFPRPLITAVQAPVFHSYAILLHLQLLDGRSVDEVAAQLSRSAGLTAHTGADGPSPVGVVGSDKIHIGRIHRDRVRSDWYSLWLVADNLRIAASNAILMAEYIILAPTLDA
jgi:aspartate-semialdehyde dehydrogenase